ncbi:hypothetical protein D3C85_1478830 [compost metagenome]
MVFLCGYREIKKENILLLFIWILLIVNLLGWAHCHMVGEIWWQLVMVVVWTIGLKQKVQVLKIIKLCHLQWAIIIGQIYRSIMHLQMLLRSAISISALL